MDFERKVIETVKKYSMLSPGDTVVAGVSGGADSTALLTVLCALKEKFNLNIIVAHINHMLRGDEAKRDSDYVRGLAEAQGLPFYLKECDVSKMAKDMGISEEAAGREVRYGFFNEILALNGGGKIAVAHNKGDSAETTVINLIRGASLKGLKGIAPVVGNVIRPLAECDRKSIEDYLTRKSITFMTDSTNGENIYTRNIVRNCILPQMQKINPNVISTIYENSLTLAEDEDFIISVCREYEKQCIKADEGSAEVDFSLIPDMHIAVKKRLLIRCCEILKGSSRDISSANLSSVISLPTGGVTSFNGIFVRRSYGKFIFTLMPHSTSDFSYNVIAGGNITIYETGKTYSLSTVPANAVTEYEKGVIYLDADTLGSLKIRSRANGDSFSPLGLGGTKKVKDFLIDLKIPRDQRDTLGILESDGQIAALLCLRGDDRFKVTDSTDTILMIREV